MLEALTASSSVLLGVCLAHLIRLCLKGDGRLEPFCLSGGMF